MSSNTLKVMLVDDEYLIRERLIRSIEWEAHGMKVMAEASSGLEAIEKVQMNTPDIILVDICMPFMDGIEFSGIIAEKYPQIKIIILTGHSEFEYAKKSIKIGIEDFISKPINTNEINEVLEKVKYKIEQERLFLDQYEEAIENLKENLPYLKEKFFNELLVSDVSLKEVERKLSFFHLQMPQNYFQIALLEISDEGDGEILEEKRLVFSIKGMNLVNNYIKNYDHIFCFIDNGGRIVLLSNNENICIEELCEVIKNMLLSCLNCNISVGVGNNYTDISHLQKSYSEALNALEYKVVEGKNQIICYDDICVSSNNSISFKCSDLDKLAFYLRAEMLDKAIDMVNTQLNFQNLNVSMVKGGIRIVSSTIISIILSVITSMEISYDEVFGSESNPYDYIFKVDNLPDIRLYLNEKLKKVVSLIKKVKADEISKAMEMILKYISDNIYKNDLSLKALSHKFFINYSYLSRKFKQETGSTFSEYITQLRMSMAVRIIKETDKKVYQVAEMVGIPDPHYFNICFKKYTNMSISEFRKSLSSNQPGEVK